MENIKDDKGIIRGWVKCIVGKNNKIIITREYRTLYRLTKKEVYCIKKEASQKLEKANTELVVKEIEIYITKNMNTVRHNRTKTDSNFISIETLSKRTKLSRQLIWYRHNKHPLQFPIYKINGVWGVYEDEIEIIWANGKKLQDGRAGGVRNGKIVYKDENA